jgi:hypothetical protein
VVEIGGFGVLGLGDVAGLVGLDVVGGGVLRWDVGATVGVGVVGGVVVVLSRVGSFEWSTLPLSSGVVMVPCVSGIVTVWLAYDCIHRSTVDT